MRRKKATRKDKGLEGERVAQSTDRLEDKKKAGYIIGGKKGGGV